MWAETLRIHALEAIARLIPFLLVFFAQIEDTVCDLLCDYVGITEFIKIIQEADPDPVYICQKYVFFASWL